MIIFSAFWGRFPRCYFQFLGGLRLRAPPIGKLAAFKNGAPRILCVFVFCPALLVSSRDELCTPVLGGSDFFLLEYQVFCDHGLFSGGGSSSSSTVVCSALCSSLLF